MIVFILEIRICSGTSYRELNIKASENVIQVKKIFGFVAKFRKPIAFGPCGYKDMKEGASIRPVLPLDQSLFVRDLHRLGHGRDRQRAVARRAKGDRPHTTDSGQALRVEDFAQDDTLL